MEHPIQHLIATSMQSIKQMTDVNTVIGDAITTADGTTIIPMSKVSFGFVTGGSDFSPKSVNTQNLFGGGAGAGVTIDPVAFLVINGSDVKLLPVSDSGGGAAEKMIGMIPGLIDKAKDLFTKDD